MTPARPYLAHRAPVLTDTPHTAPQGRPAQGWPQRRCSPEMAVYDSTVDSDKRPPLSPAEAWLLMVIYMVSCCIAGWVLRLLADANQATAR